MPLGYKPKYEKTTTQSEGATYDERPFGRSNPFSSTLTYTRLLDIHDIVFFLSVSYLSLHMTSFFGALGFRIMNIPDT